MDNFSETIPIDDCQNLEESCFGEICVHCNKCGRFNKEKKEDNKKAVWYLDERICDCEDCANTQTYREFITETENEFSIKHEPIDEYTDKELKKYLEFLDSLWDK